MKKTVVQFKYPTEKLKAVRHYMGKKDTDMVAELEDALQRLYEKHVPRDVREFLETQDNQEPVRPDRPRPTNAPPQVCGNRAQEAEQHTT